MSDQTQTANQTPDGAKNTASQTGLIPFFSAGDERPSIFSAKDCNRLVSILRALQQLKVTRTDAPQNPDGTFTNDGKFTLTEQNALLELFDAPGGSGGSGSSGIVPMQVVSYTTTNEYLSAKHGTFTAADTFTPDGTAAVNVALPWELRPSNRYAGTSIYEPYQVNDIIFVIGTEAGFNGVYVSGSELMLMDLALARAITTAAKFTLVSVQGDYIVCTDAASNTVNIAKSYRNRCSITTLTIDGATWNYTYTDGKTQRTATLPGGGGGGSDLIRYQRYSPRYVVGEEIRADFVGATNVTVSGTPLIWEETSGREWADKQDQGGP